MDDSSSTDLLSSTYAKWAIYTAGTSDAVIDPDSFVDFDLSGEARISDYPVEKGAFADYNKVQTPIGLRVKLACTNEMMARGDFLGQLEEMKQAIDIYDVSTPDLLYESFNLVHYDYTRKASNGVSMIVADLHFEEIRQTGQATYSKPSDSPSANDPVNAGTLAAVPPTPAQQSAAPAAGPS